MALQKPRNWLDVRNAVLAECKRYGFAYAARYNVPFGDKPVVGWTIRFAEAVGRCVRNLLMESAVVYEDLDRRVVEVGVTDLESNLSYTKQISIEKTVERSRLRSNQKAVATRTNTAGQVTYIVASTEAEMFAKESAQISRHIRQGILRIVPGDILDDALGVCEATLEATDKKDPAAAAKNVAQLFSEHGVTAAQLETFIGKPLLHASARDAKRMREAYNALKEGHASWAEIVAGGATDPAPTTPDEANAAAKLKSELKERADADKRGS